MTIIADAPNEPRPCALFTWCDGHSWMNPESEGSHGASLAAGEHESGEPRYIDVYRYVPTAASPGPARWEFSMPDSSDWSFGPAAVDEEIDREVVNLQAARAAITAFLAEHDRAEVSA